MLLYKSMVHPKLEYICSISLHLKRDIKELEKFQNKATRMITGMEWLFYKETLAMLEIFNLEKRQWVVGRRYNNQQSKRDER